MSSSIQNLAPIMPFIEPIEPIELPSFFGLQSSTINQTCSGTADLNTNHNQPQKGEGNQTGNNLPSQHNQISERERRQTSEEEAIIEKTRKELEQKICELNQLKDQLAQTEQRERELASRVGT